MMMCVDTIAAVKGLTKELKIQSSLKSSRRLPTRASISRSASPAKSMMQSGLTIKHKTLAETQEDMRQDFLTTQQKEAKKHLNKKNKRSKKESLECQMRLTGSKEFQIQNRHRHPQQTGFMEATRDNQNELQDIEDTKHISGTPVRYRAMQTALENTGKGVTHKLDFDYVDETMPYRDTMGRPTTNVEETGQKQTLFLNESTQQVQIEDFNFRENEEQCMSQQFVETQDKQFMDSLKSGEFNMK